ncbi:redox-regulated ATPase YchF, partial [Candidatus Peregrinibacteria bacterium CG_4_10_14_0_2_um_filter_41_8]
MPLQIGIVGLPNVGKSTLFNALTKTKGAEAANYPFCTINPNVGVVEVPDTRMEKLAEIVIPQRVLPTIIEFVDIAGLVKGASGGEGLGNQFLANIRQCDAIAQVVRIFDDENVTHVHGNVDPMFDREVIELELILADMQTVENRLNKAKSTARAGKKEDVAYAALVQKVYDHLADNKLAIEMDLSADERLQIRDLHLLTNKPFIYVANVDEDRVAAMTPEDVRKQL